MKKIYSIMALGLVMAMGANAQTSNEPNRVIVNSTVGDKVYAVSQISQISFAKVEGEVKAEVEFKGYKQDATKGDVINVSVKRTEQCPSFCIDVLPTNTAKQYDDATMARYFDYKNAQKFDQDFDNAELTGFSEEGLKPNVSYTVVTLGYDSYGVPCETSRAEFTTPKVATIGNPSVTYTINETTSSSFTLTVKPNDDCAAFYWCQFGKGEAQAQFEQWGPMMGLSCIEEMVQKWSGIAYTETATNKWDNLNPGTDYEVLVVPTDVEGNYGNVVTIPVSTLKQGGTGVAQVDITDGGVEKIDNEDGTTTTTFTIVFTPNSETALFHDMIVDADKYDEFEYDSAKGEDGIKKYLFRDDKQDPYYNQYTTDKYRFETEVGKQYYGVAIAQNANGEWGPLTKKLFTVPSAAGAAPAKAMKFTTTAASNAGVAQRLSTGTAKKGVPAIKGGIKLVNVAE